jgi:hypothetical protein
MMTMMLSFFLLHVTIREDDDTEQVNLCVLSEEFKMSAVQREVCGAQKSPGML